MMLQGHQVHVGQLTSAEEARFCVRQTRRRFPAWKLKTCIDELNASPVDLMRVAEVTDIRFASLDLVCVAAQSLNEITKESESERVSTDAPNADVLYQLHVMMIGSQRPINLLPKILKMRLKAQKRK